MLRTAIFLVLTALLIVLGSGVYHYDVGVCVEVVMLVLIVVLGLGVLSIFVGRPGRSHVRTTGSSFTTSESIVLATGLGFVGAALVHWFAMSMGWLNPASLLIVVGLAIAMLAVTRSFGWAAIRLAKLVRLLPLMLLVVFAFNLQGFHYGADGSIIARGLFGEDLPFLAGEIDGLRYLPHLADLHQYAQGWSYHDATYRVLAMSDGTDTLDLLAWAFPLVGFAVLAFGAYAVVDRLTRNRFAAFGVVVLWFLSSAFWSSELTSYALSPSFIVGSVLLLALLLVVHEYIAHRQMRIAALGLLLLIALSRFKLSTFLVAGPALGIVALMLLKRDAKLALVLGGAGVIALIQLFLLGTPTSALMPSGDFLVGAPLLGYANHLSAILHIPLRQINPVTHSGIGLRSLLVIPYSVFHIARLVVLDPRVLAAVVLGVLVIRRKFTLPAASRSIAMLLLLEIPIGFLLPILYSPSWYPLALSFYAPLVSSQAAVLLVAFGIDRAMRGEFRNRWVTLALALVCCVSIIFGIRSASKAIAERPFVVSHDLRSVLTALKMKDPGDHSILATRRFDLDPTDTSNDESFYWYAALGGHPVISEGAKYGSLLAAVADRDSAKGLHPVHAASELLARRRSDLRTIYYSGDTGVVFGELRRARVGYVLERLGLGTPDEQVHVDLSKIGTIAHRSGNARLWRIR